MAYPSTFDTFVGTAAQGNTSLAGNDHALDHRQLGSAAVALQITVGTTGGTNVLKNFVAGDFPTRINSSNVLQQATQGTMNNSIFGTARTTGGTVSGAILGTNQVTGGTVTAALLGTNQITGGTITGALIGTNQITGGTLANAAIGTPTLLGGTIAVSGTTTPIRPGAALAPTMGTAADAPSGTITVNAQAAQLYEIVCGTTAGNRTLGTPANLVDGQFLGYRVQQNANNTGTLVFPAIYRFASGGTPALGTQSTWNYIGFRYRASDAKLDYQGASLGLI